MSPTTLQADCNTFYVQDSRSYLGNCMMFHANNMEGYTTDLTRAMVFTRLEAMQQHEARITDIPWPKEYIDVLARPMVDQQRTSPFRETVMQNAHIKLIKPKKERPKKHLGRCDECGSYMSAEQVMKTGCPRCGA